jgi:hypothetical protein
MTDPIAFQLPKDADTAVGTPERIEHGCDYMIEPDGTVMFHYNFLVYHWSIAGETIVGRAYLDEIQRISVFVPNSRLRTDPLLQPVVHYLQQRFREIHSFHATDTALAGTGYAPAFSLQTDR